MEGVCGVAGAGAGASAGAGCGARALAGALQLLHLYCATVAAALICCCAPTSPMWNERRWRGQDIRGVANLIVGAIWCCQTAAAALRPDETVHLVSSGIAPASWLAAAFLHAALWTRRAASPVLYLAIYWLLTSATHAALLYYHIKAERSWNNIEVHIYGGSALMAFVIAVIDSICFYDEVAKRNQPINKSSETSQNIAYRHKDAYFYSKISFYWLNSLMYQGFHTPLEAEDLGELHEDEKSQKHHKKFMKIYKDLKPSPSCKKSLLQCYMRMVWPNFYIAGAFKLVSDMLGVVPPMGLAVIINFLQDPMRNNTTVLSITVGEFLSNGYIMLVIVTLALVGQAFLSQNSTHLVTVEGIRLKTALQCMVYDKCMKLAPWSSSDKGIEEDSPLLNEHDKNSNTHSGILTNIMSQDTYNIMSCVWICHYIWAIPLKVSVILYLLYTKLGVSAIIGSAASILIITPMQFYIGKKISDNSKDISKCTDHRISKMAEILQGINVIKLYVWEDLFKEKILNLREVELQLLNKDSIYWSILTFSTQISTILVTAITFLTYYFLGDSKNLTPVNVFAGLALFNQLSIPLLILPVTVMMVIQAMVSTKRIQDFLELPESINSRDHHEDNQENIGITNKETVIEHQDKMEEQTDTVDDDDHFSDDEATLAAKADQEYIIRFRNAIFSWGMKNDTLLEVDNLDIPSGKVIMVVGSSGSGKTSFLSAILGEMNLERGDVWAGDNACWFAGQPPWLLEGSVRDNIVMNSPWCQRKYARVLRATGLRPDLQLLPDGDSTTLGMHGAPLSGGQRVRVCLARALYSSANVLVFDEPLGALDAGLARHVVARAFVPAARAGRTVVLATSRLELLHYADLVIALEDGRVSCCGRVGCDGVERWTQLAAEARAAAARVGAGPPGGSARERSHLVRALSRARFHAASNEDTLLGINEATGAHLLAEVATRAGGSWRRAPARLRPVLSRQLSSPPPGMHNKWRREVRRAVSADASNTALRREASLLRRFLRPQPNRTLARWTPRTLRRLLSSDSEAAPEAKITNGTASADDTLAETTYSSLTSNGMETVVTESPPKVRINRESPEAVASECEIWWEYTRACGWWSAAYVASAAAAQLLAVAADYWLTGLAASDAGLPPPLTEDDVWARVREYVAWGAGGLAAAGGAGAALAGAGGRARRRLHDRLLHAALHARAHPPRPALAALHRFSADVLVIDKKLPIAVSRWLQLSLLCGAALVVNACAAPWTLLALLPAAGLYFLLLTVYLRNARELQRVEVSSAARVVSWCAQTAAGGGAVRAARLQTRMRSALYRRLDANHNALLLLNAANRWLPLTLDLVGAGSVLVSLGVALRGGGAALSGLAGAYSLLLPTYLAHLAKCRADLHLQLAAVERIKSDTEIPQEDYRDQCALPENWQRNGKIDFDNVSVQPDAGTVPVLSDINFSIAPGEKVAICGRSGSGKSTLLLACAGAMPITGGRIFLDNADTSKVPLRTLRHRVVVLPQEAILFSGTLRENLDPLAVHTDEEIWTCLKAVGLYDFVHAQPAGLECSVWGGGWRRGWSAGRAARACAARAALHARPAAALLLDEPAAPLDAPAERALLDALAALAPSTTVLTVAHRVASVRGYDRVVVLEDGRVVEQGAVTALLANSNSRLARMLATVHSH